MLEKLDVLIIGNHIQSAKYAPEIVNIANLNGKNISKFESNAFKFDDFLHFHIYGMVATILKEEIHFCGGGILSSECLTLENIFSTTHCKSLNLMEYTMTNINISMTEERNVLAYLIHLKNVFH